MGIFLRNFDPRIKGLSAQVAQGMSRTICIDSSRYLNVLKCNIFPQKCTVVTSSYSEDVTIAGF